MMKCFEDFDVGFFDLIIADESHRSIYKKFRALFQYFDALQVGLTATPVRFIERNTYELFGCEDRDPTSHFSFEDAINSKPPFLVPFRVRAFSSQFREKGFRYSQMNAGAARSSSKTRIRGRSRSTTTPRTSTSTSSTRTRRASSGAP